MVLILSSSITILVWGHGTEQDTPSTPGLGQWVEQSLEMPARAAGAVKREQRFPRGTRDPTQATASPGQGWVMGSWTAATAEPQPALWPLASSASRVPCSVGKGSCSMSTWAVPVLACDLSGSRAVQALEIWGQQAGLGQTPESLSLPFEMRNQEGWLGYLGLVALAWVCCVSRDIASPPGALAMCSAPAHQCTQPRCELPPPGPGFTAGLQWPGD